MNDGGANPAHWRDLSAQELIELLLHVSARTPASVVDAINARIAYLVAAESAGARGAPMRSSSTREITSEAAGRPKDTFVLIVVLGLLAGVIALFVQ